MRTELAEYLPNVFRFARHLAQDQHLAEDLAQEAILRAIENWSVTVPERPLVWLFRVLENLWRDRCRQRERRPENQSLDLMTVSDPIGSEPSKIAEQSEEAAIAMNIMQKLPERQRMVIHMFACEQLSIGEIAEVLEISSEAVRSSLSLARKELRHSLTSKTQR